MRKDHCDLTYPPRSLEILEQAVAEVGLDHDKLREVISSGTFETINGSVHFTGVENDTTPTAFLQLQDGEMHLVWPASIATADYMPR